MREVPESLEGLKGNELLAMKLFVRHGATHYTLMNIQGVPGKGYSTQYCYTVYTGYR